MSVKSEIVLGIESSCDETAAAFVTSKKEVLANVVYSQIPEHRPFGGVVPEIAARAHLEKIDYVVEKAFADAGVSPEDISAIAGTCGPGLIGGVIVGATFAKTLALAFNKPFIAINHIEAHAISVRLTESLEFPYLLLLASGGHCQICIVHDIDNFEVIGKTLDDSVGESFDKVAKMLDLGYPGGPAVEKAAKAGDCRRFLLPRPLCTRHSCDFSFSGLKTAVRTIIEKYEGQMNEQDKIDLCASFQASVTDVIAYKMDSAINLCSGKIPIAGVVISGGVAANQAIRSTLQELCTRKRLKFLAPPLSYCTDNAAMIAWLGVEKFAKKQFNELNFRPRPRWPLSCK